MSATKGEIVRLHCAVEEMSRRRKKTAAENNGNRTEELDSELCRLFDEGMKKRAVRLFQAQPGSPSPGWKVAGRL